MGNKIRNFNKTSSFNGKLKKIDNSVIIKNGKNKIILKNKLSI